MGVYPALGRRVPRNAIRAGLDKVARSEPFSSSRRLIRFLHFIVESKLTGKSSDLKEYVIGVNVFDRPESFDPRLDPIVRVEAGRLRAKLREYYDTVGLEDPVRIALPKRTYVPEIEFLRLSCAPLKTNLGARRKRDPIFAER